MSWQSSRASIADLERLLHQVEGRLAQLSRSATVSSSAVPRAAADRAGDAIAAALNDIAERFRGRARTVADEASQIGDDALKLGNGALRTISREVEQRPLVTLAVAFGVGMIAAGLLARRS